MQPAMPSPDTTGVRSPPPTTHPLADIDPLQPSARDISVFTHPQHSQDIFDPYTASLLRATHPSADAHSLTSSTRTKSRSRPTTPNLSNGDDGQLSPVTKKDRLVANNVRDRERTGKRPAEATAVQNKKTKEEAALAKWRVSYSRERRCRLVLTRSLTEMGYRTPRACSTTCRFSFRIGKIRFTRAKDSSRYTQHIYLENLPTIRRRRPKDTLVKERSLPIPSVRYRGIYVFACHVSQRRISKCHRLANVVITI